MKNELALRYLLLRHLERWADKVPRDRHHEVTSSLRVEAKGRKAYVVRYQDLGEAREWSFAFDTFSFYERGDTRPEQRSIEDDLRNRNDEHAVEFARRVFGVEGSGEPRRRLQRIEAFPTAAIAEMVVFPLAVGVAGGFGAASIAVLAVLCLAEFAPRGRLLASVLFSGIAWTGPVVAAAVGAFAYALLQGLDPSPELRRSRVMLCLLACAVATFRAAGSLTFEIGLSAIAIALGATLLAAYHSLHTSHFRALSLALPFYCAGLALGGYTRAAVCGLVILAAGALVDAVGHHLAPVQSSRG